MAAPTNTVVTTTAIGNREDLADLVSRISADKTPFISNIGKQKASATNPEWQKVDIATPDPTNAQLEGDDVSTFTKTDRERIGGRTQIFRKSCSVSATQEAVDTAGVKSEMAFQKLMSGKELMTDMEARFIGNYASNVESGATPRRAGGALAWLETNTSRGATGANGGFSSGDVAAATNGTQRSFAESQIQSVMATAFNNGAAPSQIYLGATHKQEFSAFTGISSIRTDANGAKQATIVGAADVYVSDFGTLTTIPVQYGLTRDALLIDPSYWAVGTLRDVKYQKLSKTGDGEKGFVVAEKTLVCKNEKGGAVIADLT